MKRCCITREQAKKTIKFLIAILIISIPFIHSTQILGINTFLDSFDKSSDYILIEHNEKYLVIQKTISQISINKNDNILYYDKKGEIEFDQIKNINAIGIIKRFYTMNNDNPIYETQIIGKVIKVLDNNILNCISINIWDISIHNLNINSLIIN